MSRSHRIALLGATLVAVTLGAVGCASTPPEQDPVFLRLNDMDARLAKVERILGNQSLVELAQQLESLQADVRSLRGDLEQLQHSSESGRSQQRDLYADLDKRLQTLEGATSAASSASAAGKPAAGAAGTDQGYYDTAFNLLKGGQYDKAITAFQQFLAAFPDSTTCRQRAVLARRGLLRQQGFRVRPQGLPHGGRPLARFAEASGCAP